MAKTGILKAGVTIFKLLGILGLVLGIVSGVLIFVTGGTPDTPRWLGVLSILMGVLYLFIFFILAEVIAVLLEIRDSVKKTV